MKFINSRGDTIVEVLIAITVMSSILGGAFVSARRSTNATRASQERVEALTIAQGQLERARASVSIPKCYKTDGSAENSDLSACQVNGLYSPEITSTTVVAGFTDITVNVGWEGVGGMEYQNLKIVYRRVD